ncbi:hypothetical protein BAE44_0006568 [Dichanthelium oligosanthes]|uniref:Protein kinase domain-containing protein n=1 Tax=Dichanthelium oligosanthes TaxID=888268 RepID=A0A1E5W4Z4_9POAL|nr:hypothetical protein BAE44_0006568 [Dichanthelium oligosanthes]
MMKLQIMRNIKFLNEIGKLAAKCLNLDVKMRPQMLEVADCLRTIRKALRRAQGNMSQGFLSRWMRSPSPNKLILEKQSEPALRYFGDLKVFTRQSEPAPRYFGDLKVFTRQEMEEITRNYSMIFREEFNEILYNGVVGKDCPVIVKNIAVCSETERENFLQTMSILCQKKHRNVANVIGFHFEENICKAVYESSSDLSLLDNESISFTSRNLYETISSRQKLALSLRLSIAAQCAEGLVHIHSLLGEDLHSNGSDLLANFRSANIFLDKNFMPKVFNTNLSTFLGVSVVQQYISANKFYDPGSKIYYSDPIDVAGLQFNPKSDIYSFGIVLLELITWKPAKYFSGGKTHVLATDFLEAYRTSSSPLDIFDKEVYNKQDMFFLQEVITIAVECLQLDLKNRPELNHILSRLQIIAEAQSCFTRKHTGKPTSLR